MTSTPPEEDRATTTITYTTKFGEDLTCSSRTDKHTHTQTHTETDTRRQTDIQTRSSQYSAPTPEAE